MITPPTVLGIDTATASTVAGVLLPDQSVHAVVHHPAADEPPRHASRLLAFVHEAMDRAGVGWRDVERLAVGVGPGGFTGLRIGIATARALAQAQAIPVVPVGTLDALARDRRGESETVVAVTDARRREVFAAAWSGSERVLGAAALPPEELAAWIAEQRPAPLLFGDGALRYRAQLESAGAVVHGWAGAHRVDPGAVCWIGAQEAPVPLADLLPDYIRDPDAKPRTA